MEHKMLQFSVKSFISFESKLSYKLGLDHWCSTSSLWARSSLQKHVIQPRGLPRRLEIWWLENGGSAAHLAANFQTHGELCGPDNAALGTRLCWHMGSGQHTVGSGE